MKSFSSIKIVIKFRKGSISIYQNDVSKSKYTVFKVDALVIDLYKLKYSEQFRG